MVSIISVLVLHGTKPKEVNLRWRPKLQRNRPFATGLGCNFRWTSGTTPRLDVLILCFHVYCILLLYLKIFSYDEFRLLCKFFVMFVPCMSFFRMCRSKHDKSKWTKTCWGGDWPLIFIMGLCVVANQALFIMGDKLAGWVSKIEQSDFHVLAKCSHICEIWITVFFNVFNLNGNE